MKRKQLSSIEKMQIAYLFGQNLSQREISNKIQRSLGSVNATISQLQKSFNNEPQDEEKKEKSILRSDIDRQLIVNFLLYQLLTDPSISSAKIQQKMNDYPFARKKSAINAYLHKLRPILNECYFNKVPRGPANQLNPMQEGIARFLQESQNMFENVQMNDLLLLYTRSVMICNNLPPALMKKINNTK